MACYVHLEVLCIAGSGWRSDYEALYPCFKCGSECVNDSFVEVVEEFLVSLVSV